MKPLRIFVKAPWTELWQAAGEPTNWGCMALVNHWNWHNAHPKGYKVARWRYNNAEDSITMEVVKLEKA